ncbi:MAG: hypothetical protein HY866_12365 [Chloroflexi bacterium]|nr:hypothetical protein [Chloroflexota bacterium]
MYRPDAEMIFPARLIGTLRHARGEEWQVLVERVMHLPETDPDVLAFSLMMIRLNGCLKCLSDSFRAMRGCESCARQTIARAAESDAELLLLWEAARDDVTRWLEAGISPVVE